MQVAAYLLASISPASTLPDTSDRMTLPFMTYRRFSHCRTKFSATPFSALSLAFGPVPSATPEPKSRAAVCAYASAVDETIDDN